MEISSLKCDRLIVFLLHKGSEISIGRFPYLRIVSTRVINPDFR